MLLFVLNFYSCRASIYFLNGALIVAAGELLSFFLALVSPFWLYLTLIFIIGALIVAVPLINRGSYCGGALMNGALIVVAGELLSFFLALVFILL